MKPAAEMTKRPFIFLNVATSADGKLAPDHRHFIPFSSREDQEFLWVLRTRADAVMAGARTVDSIQVDLGPGPRRFRQMRLAAGRAEYNLRIIVSGSGSIDPAAHIFTRRFSPIILLTTERAKKKLKDLGKLVDAIGVFGKREIDFARAFSWLRSEWKIKRLLCEGGGVLNGTLLELGMVDEIYQTLTPVIIGGRTAPTLADGKQNSRKDEATRLEMKSVRRVGDELFLVWKVTNKKERLL